MRIVTTLFILTLSFVFSSLQAQNKTVSATVINVTSNDGNVSFALYDKATFLKQPLKATISKIEDGKSKVTFENVKAGQYAIVCFHDKNENGKMDFAANRMPLENYGASNNVLTMGPPQFADAKFEVTDKDVSLEIKF